MLTSLLTVVLILLVLGVVLWGIANWPNLDAAIKQMVRVIAIVIASIWVLIILFGLIGIHLPK